MPLLRGAHDPRGDRFELLHVGDAAAAVLLDDDRHAHRILSPRWLYNPDFCIQRRSLMTVRQLVRSLALLAALLAPALVPTISAQQSGNQVALRTPDVIFVPTPEEVVDVMLKVAKVTKNDVVYDLGSGDGRIPITAARQYGARAVGIDIDPVRIGEANANLKMAAATDPGLLNRVRFRRPGSVAAAIFRLAFASPIRTGSMSMPTARAPYCLAAAIGMRPSPEPRS